jgi:hypothetical protein
VEAQGRLSPVAMVTQGAVQVKGDLVFAVPTPAFSANAPAAAVAAGGGDGNGDAVPSPAAAHAGVRRSLSPVPPPPPPPPPGTAEPEYRDDDATGEEEEEDALPVAAAAGRFVRSRPPSAQHGFAGEVNWSSLRGRGRRLWEGAADSHGKARQRVSGNRR